MRLFVAIDLTEDVIERLSSIQEKLSSGDFDLKLVERENLHLTLKFLGEVQESHLERVEKLASEAVNGFHAFTLSFHGIGHFGSGRFVKVIWAGVDSGRDEFVGLAKELDKRLSFIRKDEHGPSPHLTITRVKSGRNADLLLRELGSLRDVKVGEVRVKEVKLKQSVLTPHGPIYSDVKVFPLTSQKEGVSGRLQSGERDG
jgi:2'-5' RNA ligase